MGETVGVKEEATRVRSTGREQVFTRRTLPLLHSLPRPVCHTPNQTHDRGDSVVAPVVGHVRDAVVARVEQRTEFRTLLLVTVLQNVT